MGNNPMDGKKWTPGVRNPDAKWKPAVFHDYLDEREYLKVCDILCGDKNAFNNLVIEYQKVAEEWAKGIKTRMVAGNKRLKELNGFEEDRDLVQDMWIRLLKIIPGRFRIKSSKPATVCTFYMNLERKIYNLLRNAVRDNLRAVLRRNEVNIDSYQDLSTEYDFLDFEVFVIKFLKRKTTVKDPIIAEKINASLEKMSDKEKRIFELAITTDKPYVVIGEMNDLSEKTIRNTMSRLYKIIRETDNKDPNEEDMDKVKREDEKDDSKEM